MRTYGSDVRQERTLAQTFDDTVAIISQDASEYGFMALLGAFPACIAVIVLRAAGGDIGSALVAPAVVAIAAVTLATAAEAFRRVVDNLEPDAARSLAAVLPRIQAVLAPWLTAAGAGFVAVLAQVMLDAWVPSLVLAGVVLVVLGAGARHAFGLSFVVPAELLRHQRAADVSRALVAAAPGKVAAAWAIVLAPAGIMAMLALMAGFGTLSTSIFALVFAGSMPAAAVMMSLLYYDALSRAR